MASTTTVTPGRTVRKVQPIPQTRNRLELALWLFMRYSGLALVFLALSHFWMQHVLIGTHEIEFAGTQLRWGITGQPVTVEQVIWRAYYAVMLVLAVTHGINGVRQVAYDYFGHRPAIYKGLMSVIVAVAALISLGGIAALFMGAAASGGEAALR
ncbi:MAG: hypothetical protein D6709_13250 [Chloroflexi bacterium]|jgi:succinate dehydrogenase / fumarate reductase membrane anchor subunit|uniref:Succinate dehydrogenase n=1 Tax=Candidatus Thermofonsia Clade 3 bacterium TaxID=2364212 RepID=A0A2M8QEE6_9CHLR|nr:hypothetical protein [Candidatus Roseilinea sp. NK_OTU-006]PJF48176.1 MAG: hypothetical protein CUN48_04965 [Candidatus Thermofonsia Clade 3 bacterium]RMG61970.1 MAG: hypothetical protein D6709_13250 [Chloroflexota bacterium]